MLLNEDDAKQRWCPHIRIARREAVNPVASGADDIPVVVAGCNSDGLGRTRVPASCRCIASDCMAWRWAGWLTDFNTIAPGARPATRTGPRLGFCGLAGQPNLSLPEEDRR